MTPANRLPNRLRFKDESGLTLVELVTVFVVLAILLAVSIPSYIGMRERANKGAAQSAVRSSVPAIEAYKTENGTYVGISPTTLAAAYGPSYAAIEVPLATATAYCVQATVDTIVYSKTGPSGDIVESAC